MADAQQRQSNTRAMHTTSARAFVWLPRLLAAIVFAGALVLGGWHALAFTRHSAAALATPYPLDGLEGTLLHEAWLLRSGEALYQPLQLDRFVSSPYPPLHYALLALFAPPDGMLHVFFQGRLVSLGAMLVVALALACMVLRLGRSLPAALVAVALWLAFPPVQLWATRVKPDPLALALTALGLLSITFGWHQPVRDNNRPSRRAWLSLVLAAVCFGLACLTKQTAVAAPVATALALLLSGSVAAVHALREHAAQGPSRYWPRFVTHRALRPALLFGSLYAALVVLPWLALDYVTGGQYTFHIWGLHRSEWWSATLLNKFLELLQPSWPLALLGVVALVLAVRQLFAARRAPTATMLLPACYLLVAPITLLGAGETGANHNHLLEMHLAMIIAGCALTGQFTGAKQQIGNTSRASLGNWWILAVGCVLLLQLWQFRERPAWYGGEFDLDDTPARYVAFIRAQPGEVLADNVGLLVTAGRPLRYDDPSTMGPAVSSGVWDERTLLAEVAAQKFSAILVPLNANKDTRDATGRWSPQFIAALREHYKVLYRDRITTYVPR